MTRISGSPVMRGRTVPTALRPGASSRAKSRSTTTGRQFAPSSLASNHRPSATSTPSTRAKPSVTRLNSTSTAVPSSVNCQLRSLKS
jgi:hypothetical protein